MLFRSNKHYTAMKVKKELSCNEFSRKLKNGTCLGLFELQEVCQLRACEKEEAIADYLNLK